jgi:hypothetical protein
MKVIGISFTEEQVEFIESQDDTKSGYVRGLVERAMKRATAKRKKKRAVAKKVTRTVQKRVYRKRQPRPQPASGGCTEQESLASEA